MPDQEQDVKVEAPSTSDETPESVSQEIPVQESQEQASQPEEVKPSGQPASDTDERGVPLYNRYAELNRKYQELNEKFEKVSQSISTPPSSARPLSQYSIEQLEYAALRDPNLRPQVESEKYERQQETILRRMREQQEQEVKQRQFREQEAQAWSYVASSYPEVLTPDKSKIDQSNPIVQKALEIYHSDPRFKDSGAGWRVAFDAAYGQVAREKEVRRVGKERRTQRTSLPASGSTASNPPKQKPEAAKDKKMAELLEARRKYAPSSREYLDLSQQVFKLRGLIGSGEESE